MAWGPRDPASGKIVAVNETGKRYGRLVVIERVDDPRRHGAFWRCRCDCGTMCTVLGRSLRVGATHSCGCLKREVMAAANRLPPGVGLANAALCSMKVSAKTRGYEWRLSDAEARGLMAGHCHYCGAPPSNRSSRQSAHHGAFAYSGIDRVDNARGYEAGNVVPCCAVCNWSKGPLSRDEFLAWVERVYNHSVRAVVAA